MYTFFDSVSCRLSIKIKSLGGVALVAADLALLSFMSCDLICYVVDVLSLYKKEKKKQKKHFVTSTSTSCKPQMSKASK